MPAQNMEALAKANRVRLAGVQERAALRGKPVSEISAALVEPTEALASMKLRILLCPTYGNGGSKGIFLRLGPHRLRRALNALARDCSLGRVNWHPELRLRELNRRERERLVEELVRVAPYAESGAVG